MKIKKQTKKGKMRGNACQDEEDKTAFEKIEDEVRQIIFNVLYVLLKEGTTTYWRELLMVFLDFF